MGTTGHTGPAVRLDPIERAVADLAAGRLVVVVDDEDRENEGDLIVAADVATTEAVGFMVRHTSGVICVGMTGAELDRLELPQMVAFNADPKQTAYTVSVDARAGHTTGISARERAITIRALGNPATEPTDLTRPGHVFPLRAVPGGVRERGGHTEAGVELARLAGHTPAAALSEIVDDAGEPMRGPALRAFADEHGLAMVSIADLVVHLADPAVAEDATPSPVATVAAIPVEAAAARPTRVVRTEEADLPTRFGTWRAISFHDTSTDVDHLALVMGDVDDGAPVEVRVHSECLTGDALGSWRCDCGAQLQAAQERIAGLGRGVVVYVRGHEGRGIGLRRKIAAYALQDLGRDTIEANLELGLPADARDYTAAAEILTLLGISSVVLITHNEHKSAALRERGIAVVEELAMPVLTRPENLHYLRTKRDRMGHRLGGLDLPTPTTDKGNLA